MYYYAFSLRRASFLMANSSWTKNHVDSILQHHDALLDFVHLLSPLTLLRLLQPGHAAPQAAQIVYPPCDTREMAMFPLEGREPVILSVAQFRPEKDHAAQLRAFSAFLAKYPEWKDRGVQLVLIGGSRNAEDAARVDGLRALARELGIEVRLPLYPSINPCLTGTPEADTVHPQCAVPGDAALARSRERRAQHDGGRALRDQRRRVHGRWRRARHARIRRPT